jgi:hypothetical protein
MIDPDVFLVQNRVEFYNRLVLPGELDFRGTAVMVGPGEKLNPSF